MFSKKDYSLGAHFLPYLINNDPSGLTDEEIEALDNWLIEELKELGNPTNHYFTYSTDKDFAICNVSLSYTECLPVTLMYLAEEDSYKLSQTNPLYVNAVKMQYILYN